MLDPRSFLILAAFNFFKVGLRSDFEYNSVPLSNCQKPQMDFGTNLISVSQHIIPPK